MIIKREHLRKNGYDYNSESMNPYSVSKPELKINNSHQYYSGAGFQEQQSKRRNCKITKVKY